MTLATVSACAHRANRTTTVAPSSSSATTTEPTATVTNPQTVNSATLRLNEVQLTETAGQRSLLFRFSRPPEGVDYFPLRNPSRLVIDVKGPIDSPTKVQTYKATDAQVTSVRVGSYQGRLRLVIDLKGTAAPQFSVDNYETLVSAFIGEKDLTKRAVQSRSQMLVASTEDGRGTQGLAASVPTEKKPTSLAKSAGSDSQPVRPTTAAGGDDKTKSIVAAEALPEEKLSSPTLKTPEAKPTLAMKTPEVKPTTPEVKPITPALKASEVKPTTPEAKPTAPALKAPEAEPATETAAPALESSPAPSVKKPIDIAQAAPERSPSSTPRPRSRRPRAEAEPPPVSSDSSSSLGPSGEFRPVTEYSGRKISLDFKNADIHDVFRILADVSGLNLVATDDVKARVTLRLVEIPWDQALDVVLQANGLEKTRTGNVITISTTKRLETERNARLLAQNAQRKIAPLETAYVKINYVKATDIVAILTREIEQQTSTSTGIGISGGAPVQPSGGAGGKNQQVAVMSPRGTVAADATTNVVIVRDIADRIAAVKELISKIDVQTPQVVIESYIVTTNQNLNRDLGIQWGYQHTASPQTGNATGVNFPGTIGFGGSGLGTGSGQVPFIADFPAATNAGSGTALDLVLGSLNGAHTLDIRLSALETQGKARVISRPRVVTLNNKIAQIKSRREIRVPIISNTLNVGGAGSTQGGGTAFQEFDVGITLKITPQISSDGFVLLDIDAESSELTADASVKPSAPSAFVPNIPDTLTRTTQSNVLIRAGETFVLGGILQDNMRQTDKGTPYFRDIPGLGWLFSGRTKSRASDELLIFVTPKLVVGSRTTGLPTAQQLWENRSRDVDPMASSSAATVGP